MINLPNDYVERMKVQLGEEYRVYERSLQETPVRGLRVNTNRISAEKFEQLFEESIEKLPFSNDGYILKSENKLGNLPMHLSGLFYLQEPSSMIAVCSSEIERENRPLKVLDLCASPGGKTSQIACRISANSVLFSNEIIKSRADILFSNVERQGFENVVVLNEEPKRLSGFEGCFDYIFVDAPCSGEGMFRKTPETISEWSLANVEMCAERQKEILEMAEKLLVAGGKLVYSTCTFSELEDERVVEWFLENFNYELAEIPEEIKAVTKPVVINGKVEENARKFYPHVSRGEGQFVAVFKNLDEERGDKLYSKKHYRAVNLIGRTNRQKVDAFFAETMMHSVDWKRLIEIGATVYLAPEGFDAKLQTAIDELRIVSLGVKIGTIQKDRFEPHHNIFMALSENFKQQVELSDDELKRYLHGEELSRTNLFAGYAVVAKNGYPIGGVKISNGKLKNLYPKGMRI